MLFQTILFVMTFLFGWSQQCNDFSKVTSPEKKYELIGLFPVNVTGKVETEVLVWSEAFRYFVEQSNILYGDIFFYRMYDLCWNEDYDLMTNVTMDIILEAGTSNNNVCTCVPKNYNLYETLGIVGAANSFNTEYISTVVRTEDITLISYASTNEQLSDKYLYPNVLRTIPTDSYQSNAINDLLRLMNWTYITLVFEDTSYGLSGQSAITSSKSCISVEISLSSGILSKETIDDLFNTLKQETRSNVIVLWGQFTMIKSILENAASYDFHDRVWIMSDAAGRNSWFLDLSKTLRGNFFHIIPFSGESVQFQNYFFNLTYKDSLDSPGWLKQFFKQQNNITNTTTVGQFRNQFDFSLVGFVRNSVFSYVNTLVKLLRKKCPPFIPLESCNISLSLFSNEYISTLKSDTYVGLDGQYFSYDINGDVNATSFKIYSIDTDRHEFFLFGSWSSQMHLYDVNSTWMSRMTNVRSDCYCEPGTTPSNNSVSCCPTCISCSGNQFYKPNIGNDACQQCPHNQFADHDKRSCRFIENSYIKMFQYEAIIIFVVSFSGILSLLITVFIFVTNRTTPVIRSSNFQLSLIQLLCHAAVFALPLLFVGKDSTLKCQIRTYGSCFFFVFIIVISITKITRLVKIFNIKHRLTKSEILQQKTYELLIVVVSMAIDLVIAVIVSSVYSIKVNEESKGTDTMMYYVCTDGNHYTAHVVYVILLQLICGVQSFRGRHLPAKYNEAKYTSFSMFTSMLILILAVPLTSSMDNHNTDQLLQACAILLANCVLFLSSYTYRVVIIQFYPKMNTDEVFHRKRMKSVVSNVTFTTMLAANENAVNECKINMKPYKRSISEIVNYNERIFWEDDSIEPCNNNVTVNRTDRSATTLSDFSDCSSAGFDNHAYVRDSL